MTAPNASALSSMAMTSSPATSPAENSSAARFPTPIPAPSVTPTVPTGSILITSSSNPPVPGPMRGSRPRPSRSMAPAAPLPRPRAMSITRQAPAPYVPDASPIVRQPGDQRLGALHLDNPQAPLPQPGEMLLAGQVDPQAGQTYILASPTAGIRTFGVNDVNGFTSNTQYNPVGYRLDDAAIQAHCAMSSTPPPVECPTTAQERQRPAHHIAQRIAERPATQRPAARDSRHVPARRHSPAQRPSISSRSRRPTTRSPSTTPSPTPPVRLRPTRAATTC